MFFACFRFSFSPSLSSSSSSSYNGYRYYYIGRMYILFLQRENFKLDPDVRRHFNHHWTIKIQLVHIILQYRIPFKQLLIFGVSKNLLYSNSHIFSKVAELHGRMIIACDKVLKVIEFLRTRSFLEEHH